MMYGLRSVRYSYTSELLGMNEREEEGENKGNSP